MLRDLSALQIAQWQAYYSVDPFGTEEDYRQAGIISSVIANVNRARDKTPYSPEDFMPLRYRPAPKKQTVAEMKNILNRITRKPERKRVKKVKRKRHG